MDIVAERRRGCGGQQHGKRRRRRGLEARVDISDAEARVPPQLLHVSDEGARQQLVGRLDMFALAVACQVERLLERGKVVPRRVKAIDAGAPQQRQQLLRRVAGRWGKPQRIIVAAAIEIGRRLAQRGGLRSGRKGARGRLSGDDREQ
jgi:hypothetical protein